MLQRKGLGHYFLRHIERNSTLLFLVPVDTPDIKGEYDILVNELTKYNPKCWTRASVGHFKM
jgi:GTP-binding protein